MRNRLRHLIECEQYEEACKLLNEENDPSLALLQSMLLRLQDSYKNERTLIENILLTDAENPYFNERLEWHQKPDFEKMEPRKPLHLERFANFIPQTSSIQQTCFITGGDSAYFEVLVECIESIKSSRFYKDVPIYILDCGLTDNEKATLSKMITGTIVDPGWCVEFSEFHTLDKKNNRANRVKKVHAHYKLIVSKAYLDLIFPGYEFYFWINANSWVQDERAIDAFLKICEQQSIAYPDASHGNFRTLEKITTTRTDYIPMIHREHAFKVRHGCDAAFCARASYLKMARKVLEDFVTINGEVFFYYSFELVQSVLTGKYGLKPDVPVPFYSHFNYLDAPGSGYRPRVNMSDPHVIYSQFHPDQPIGIIRPTDINSYDHTLFIQDSNYCEVGSTIGSTRFRTLPWKDKAAIKMKIRSELNSRKLALN